MGAKLGGSGGSKFDLGQNSDINVTPFVDVMLVLLIIFMVVAPLATKSIKLDLPPNVPPPPDVVQKEPVYVNVFPYGKIFVKDKETTLDALPADVAAALDSPNPTDERVMIRADRMVIYSDFMAVLNVLQYNGYNKVGLISEDL